MFLCTKSSKLQTVKLPENSMQESLRPAQTQSADLWCVKIIKRLTFRLFWHPLTRCHVSPLIPDKHHARRKKSEESNQAKRICLCRGGTGTNRRMRERRRERGDKGKKERERLRNTEAERETESDRQNIRLSETLMIVVRLLITVSLNKRTQIHNFPVCLFVSVFQVFFYTSWLRHWKRNGWTQMYPLRDCFQTACESSLGFSETIFHAATFIHSVHFSVSLKSRTVL